MVIQNSSTPDVDKQVSTIMHVWQGINLIMSVFFILAAAVNINDWDWFLWVPIYMVAAGLSTAVACKPSLADSRLWSSISVIHLTLCGAYALYTIVSVLENLRSKLENPLIHEPGRELGGLLIIITWLSINRFTNVGRPNVRVTSQSMMSALLMMTITLTILPLFMWSLCFISDWHTRLGHCTGMFG